MVPELCSNPEISQADLHGEGLRRACLAATADGPAGDGAVTFRLLHECSSIAFSVGQIC